MKIPGPRIGVYVCHCGLNIAGVINVKEVVEYAKKLPNVVVSRDYVFMCSAPGQNLIKEDIEKEKLDRVVVAACSPSMHEPTFRAALEDGGLNPYLLEMVNIREHSSWVHSKEKEAATEKAKDLIRMAVMRASLLEPLEKIKTPVENKVLVIGGGISGLRAALDLAERGFFVHLVERSPVLGGKTPRISLVRGGKSGREILAPILEKISSSEKIRLHLNSEVKSVDGSIGSFKVKVLKRPRFVNERCNLCGKCEEVCPIEVENEFEFGLNKRKAIFLPYEGSYPEIYAIDQEVCTKCGECVKVCEPGAINLEEAEEEFNLEVGAIIVAAGHDYYEPPKGEYSYGLSSKVITTLQLERLLSDDGPTGGELIVDGERPESVAFIHCVGSLGTTPSSKEYCSRMCCYASLKNALRIKKKYPKTKVFVLHKDIRTYGLDEDIYWDSLEEFVRFLRFEDPPLVRVKDGKLEIEVFEVNLQERLLIPVDLVVLSVGMVSPRGLDELSSILKISCGPEAFLKEAHLKLRPVESLSDGIFLAGSVTGPKDVIESIISGSAAASKAAGVVSKEEVEVEPIVAEVNEDLCSGCGICVSLCPYGAISIKEKEGKRLAEVDPMKCKGCGSCAASCPSGAMQQKHFKDRQIMAEIVSLREVMV